MGQALAAGLFIGIPLVQAGVSTFITRKGVKKWYPKLKKPSWTPPNWLFGPVWSLLYTGMGVASFLIWRQGGFSGQWLPLSMYGIQLLFNWAWSPTFFGAHKIGWALAVILAMDATATATTVLFFREHTVAGALMVPYLVWSAYATALNLKLLIDNPNADKIDTSASPAEEPLREGENKE